MKAYLFHSLFIVAAHSYCMAPKLEKYTSINRNALLLACKDQTQRKYVNSKKAKKIAVALKAINETHPATNNVNLSLSEITACPSDLNRFKDIIEVFQQYCVEYTVINDQAEKSIKGRLHAAVQLTPFLNMIKEIDAHTRISSSNNFNQPITCLHDKKTKTCTFHFKNVTFDLAADCYQSIDSIYKYSQIENQITIIKQEESDGALIR